MSREELKAYLAEIIELETKRYEISLSVSELEKEMCTYYQMADRQVCRERTLQKWTIDIWKEILKSAFIAGLAGIMTGFAGRVVADHFPWMMSFGRYPFVKINALWGFAGFFLISLLILVLHFIGGKYARNLKAKKYNQERESLNRRILEESQYAKKQIRILNGEIRQLNEGFQKMDNRLRELYKKDIIYSKYRELFPVSRFYEYVSSGRCSGLEGDKGAYNLYENELLAKAILDSLENACGESPML